MCALWGGNSDVLPGVGGLTGAAGALCEVCMRAVAGLCSAAKSTIAELLLDSVLISQP